LTTKIEELGVKVVGIKTQQMILSESLSYSSLSHLLGKYHAKDRNSKESWGWEKFWDV